MDPAFLPPCVTQLNGSSMVRARRYSACRSRHENWQKHEIPGTLFFFWPLDTININLLISNIKKIPPPTPARFVRLNSSPTSATETENQDPNMGRLISHNFGVYIWGFYQVRIKSVTGMARNYQASGQCLAVGR